MMHRSKQVSKDFKLQHIESWVNFMQTIRLTKRAIFLHVKTDKTGKRRKTCRRRNAVIHYAAKKNPFKTTLSGFEKLLP